MKAGFLAHKLANRAHKLGPSGRPAGEEAAAAAVDADATAAKAPIAAAAAADAEEKTEGDEGGA